MNYHNIQFTVSVQNNSNKIISSSEEKFVGISNGNLIKIGNEDILYSIIGREKYFYIRNFSIVDPKNIVIDDNINNNLQNGDNIRITFKEYELIMINELINEGKNYSLNEDVLVIGGKLNINISDGSSEPSILTITETGENGNIKQLGIKKKGKYISIPPNPCKVAAENGKDAELNVNYSECGNRTVLERIIDSITIKDNKTYIHLNYSLPINLEQGKLSVEKVSLTLDKPYYGDTESNVNYQIYKNFTPNITLPLMAKNTLSPESIFNNAVHKIDAEINKIKKHLNIP